LTDINNIKTIYFLGIGGIGMSALARYFNTMGVSVYGYDKTSTPLTEQLIKEGIKIHFEDDIKQIPKQTDLVVYTPAIPSDHKELNYFKENEYPLKKRSEVLGLLTQNYFTIAVAGTHGKTSITSMIAHILNHSEIKITAFIGGISKNYNSNLILNKETEIIVVEADEYDRSFLTLHPDIAVITAIDADHLDIYKTKKSLEESFYQFAGQVKKDGKLMVKGSIPLPVRFYNKKLNYSLEKGSEYYSENIRIKNHKYYFDLVSPSIILKDITLDIPGRHNIENAVAAFAVATLLNIDEQKIKSALESYKGVERRFDYKIKEKNIVFIDDYAHHPEELKAIISAVKELYAGKKVTGIFQPHLFSRTRDFADEFARSLELLDEIILLDIYPARELPLEGITSKMLIDKIAKKEKKLCSKDNLMEALNQRNLEVLLTIGAGDIDQLLEPIKNSLIAKYVI